MPNKSTRLGTGRQKGELTRRETYGPHIPSSTAIFSRLGWDPEAGHCQPRGYSDFGSQHTARLGHACRRQHRPKADFRLLGHVIASGRGITHRAPCPCRRGVGGRHVLRIRGVAPVCGAA